MISIDNVFFKVVCNKKIDVFNFGIKNLGMTYTQ